jgi:hypothetical protein
VRWGIFAVALVCVFVMQTSLIPLLPDLPQRSINAYLVLLLVVGFLAPPADLAIAAWIIGLASDLDGSGPIGADAVAFGIAALALCRLRDSINRELWWARSLAGVMGCVLALALSTLLTWVNNLLWPTSAVAAGPGVLEMLGISVVAALIFTLLHAVMGWLVGSRRRHYGRRSWL